MFCYLLTLLNYTILQVLEEISVLKRSKLGTMKPKYLRLFTSYCYCCRCYFFCFCHTVVLFSCYIEVRAKKIVGIKWPLLGNPNSNLSNVVLHQRLSLINSHFIKVQLPSGRGCVSIKVVFHRRLSSITSCLPSNVVSQKK